MTSPRTSPHEGLLERPLSPRSLVASLLMGMDPPRMRGADLVAWCELFGVGEGTTRVALSRMVERTELSVSDGRYELAGWLQTRRGAQEGAVDPRGRRLLEPWSGQWSMVVVRKGRRSASERSRLRKALSEVLHAELREGVWLRPANLDLDAVSTEGMSVVDDQCDRWIATPQAPLAVDSLFELTDWIERAAALIDELDLVGKSLTSDGDIPRGFYAGAATLRLVRRDPLLPDELLPDDWNGDALRRSYSDYQARFAAAAERFLRARRTDAEPTVSLAPVTSAETLK